LNAAKGDGMEKVLVLVVEDEALIQFEIESALQEGGYTTHSVATGKAAFARLDGTTDVRALVTDVNLGNAITGWDVARRARELNPELPVVYVTSVSSADWSAHGVPNSILIGKPFVAGQIITAISQLLNASGTQPTAQG
jgi:CheY-like chemotaxis protein